MLVLRRKERHGLQEQTVTIIFDNTLNLKPGMVTAELRTAIIDWAHGDFLNRGDTCQALLEILERRDKEAALLKFAEVVSRNVVQRAHIDLYDTYEVDHVPFDRKKILAALKHHSNKGKPIK